MIILETLVSLPPPPLIIPIILNSLHSSIQCCHKLLIKRFWNQCALYISNIWEWPEATEIALFYGMLTFGNGQFFGPGLRLAISIWHTHSIWAQYNNSILQASSFFLVTWFCVTISVTELGGWRKEGRQGG